MTYRIGIYDPAFRPEGHFVAFDRYIGEILDVPDIRVTYIEHEGAMSTVYQETRFAYPHDYLNIGKPPTSARFLPGRLGRICARLWYWHRTFKAIERQNLDMVLFTADARDILMCAFIPRFRYGVILLYPRMYVRGGLSAASFLYRRFIKRASIHFTTNEPPIRSDISALLGIKHIHWIPDMRAVAHSNRTHSTETTEFLTIGTILKSKNHAFALEAFAQARLPYAYLIAGKIIDHVGEWVARRVDQLSKEPNLSIRGRFGYLKEEEYTNLMQGASFLIFPYDFTRGDISSQVLHDAFSTETPFIAPDIEPFRWYVEHYGIGLLYKEGDTESFARILHSAHKEGTAAFAGKFSALQRDHSLEVIREKFLAALMPLLGQS